MASEKNQHTLADYVVIAISPALIIALVGSLVFFLVEVLYVGDFGFRMRWILFCFVFGMVLISRMTLQDEVKDRAGLYGVVLAALVWIALESFVAYAPNGPLAGFGSLVNVFFIAIIWWSTHRLTRDCTHIDDSEEASGEGLLQTAGLDEAASTTQASGDEPPEIDTKRKSKNEHTGLLGWWDRYRQYQDEQKRRPRNPGVWVVYFSLAALPIYGVGQSLIPVADADRRANAFWLMAVYVASGLGLLLTTCFLGLRRYLRQRNMQMPLAMTGVWLLVGGTMIAVLLLVGALLPRPYAEYSLFDVTKVFTAKERSASRAAQTGDEPGKDDGRPGSKSDDKKGTPGSKTKPGKQGKDGKGSSSRDKGKDGSKSADQRSDQRDDSAKGKRERDETADDPKKKEEESKNGNDDPDKESKDSQSRPSGPGKSPTRTFKPPQMPSMPTGLTNVIKWIIYAVVAIAGLWFLLKFMANFTNWARSLVAALRSLWQSLFGWTVKQEADQDDAEEPAPKRRPRPFSAFHNPFDDNSTRTPEDLVRYSFEALQAFGFERGLSRQPDETPLEYADRVGQVLPGLEADSRRLAALYARVAYARGRLPESARESVQQFWLALEEAASQQPTVAEEPS